MLEKLSLKHSTWLKMAYGICKDRYLADDIVSEMYIKMYDSKKEVNDYYIYYVIKSCFINWLRQNKKIDTIEINDNLTIFEDPENFEKEIPGCLTFSEKEILRLRQDFSCRELAEDYNIDQTKVFRIEKKAKEKIEQWKIKNYSQIG